MWSKRGPPPNLADDKIVIRQIQELINFGHLVIQTGRESAHSGCTLWRATEIAGPEIRAVEILSWKALALVIQTGRESAHSGKFKN